MRGEISVDREVLHLQPWSWNAPHQDWALAADAFPDVHRRGDTWEYPLPGPGKPSQVPNRLAQRQRLGCQKAGP